MNTATYRLNRPRGLFSENPQKNAKLKKTIQRTAKITTKRIFDKKNVTLTYIFNTQATKKFTSLLVARLYLFPSHIVNLNFGLFDTIIRQNPPICNPLLYMAMPFDQTVQFLDCI